MEGMDSGKVISAFSRLGEILAGYTGSKKGLFTHSMKEPEHLSRIDDAVTAAAERNPWFTLDHIRYSLSALSDLLKEHLISQWLDGYRMELKKPGQSRTIGVIMAGNIPLVGFHDFLCVLMSGHRFAGRLSSQDAVLLPALAEILVRIEPELSSRISFTTDKLSRFDAVIATGSNNTSVYFEHYFGKYPHIIRKNRNGIAILAGNETAEEMDALGDDVFLYFGLGCRNVSKIYLPAGYDLDKLQEAFMKYSGTINHNKYRNNYDYYKSVFLVNGNPFFDTGYLLVRENAAIASPVSVLYYEHYSGLHELSHSLEGLSEQIQCIVSKEHAPFRGCLPGRSQKPGLSDYADGIDTMGFLLGLK